MEEFGTKILSRAVLVSHTLNQMQREETLL